MREIPVFNTTGGNLLFIGSPHAFLHLNLLKICIKDGIITS